MTSSMTAFARQHSDHPWGTLVWEIRSVNHRYLEPSFRLPDSLRHLEGSLREQLRGVVQRGKVEAQLKFLGAVNPDATISINDVLLEQLHATTAHIRAKIPGCARSIRSAFSNGPASSSSASRIPN